MAVLFHLRKHTIRQKPSINAWMTMPHWINLWWPSMCHSAFGRSTWYLCLVIMRRVHNAWPKQSILRIDWIIRRYWTRIPDFRKKTNDISKARIGSSCFEFGNELVEICIADAGIFTFNVMVLHVEAQRVSMHTKSTSEFSTRNMWNELRAAKA